MNTPAKTAAQLITLVAAIAAAHFAVLAQSQSVVDPSKVPTATAEVAPTPAAAPGTLVLKEGTVVPLLFAAELSSKTAVDDDPVNLTLAEDLKVGDLVVAHKGAIALGTVTNAHKAGMMGKPGDLAIRLEYLKTDDQRIRIRGSKGKEGQSETGATVALTVIFGPLGLIKHGKNVVIPPGTPLTAFVDQDYTLAPAK
ncbi:MAG: hypothetical protein WA823_15230 [Candidatus Acidiferrales bacterium]